MTNHAPPTSPNRPPPPGSALFVRLAAFQIARPGSVLAVVFIITALATLLATKLELLTGFIRRMYEERPCLTLVVEHNMEFIMGLAREIIVMHQGAVLERGDPQAIQASPRVIEAYLG